MYSFLNQKGAPVFVLYLSLKKKNLTELKKKTHIGMVCISIYPQAIAHSFNAAAVKLQSFLGWLRLEAPGSLCASAVSSQVYSSLLGRRFLLHTH